MESSPFVLLVLFWCVSGETRPIEMWIRTGSIRGEAKNLGFEQYTTFKGIPYAAPAVGALRFKKPIKPASWRGVMNATRFAPICIQQQELNSTARMSEDCLYINVFSKLHINQSMPVIVFIHGGGFHSGSSVDIPEESILRNFVSRNVVFVTFNYRLGPFGFLTTNDQVLSGNMGLWDMIQALDWVKDNARTFGGDPNRVTLMGHGSGAVAASLLALSPKAEGYFHRVILMSGTALNPASVRSTAENATWKLQENLGCRAQNSTAVLNCLRMCDYPSILDNQYARVNYDNSYAEWVPVVDGLGGVIPESPEILASYRKKVPAMIGTTRHESVLFVLGLFGELGVNLTELSISKGEAEYLARNLTSKYEGFTNHKLITEACYFEYVHTHADPNFGPERLAEGILNMYSDFLFNAPASQLSSYYSRSRTPTFLYSFEHVTENLSFENGEKIGAFHGLDFKMFFDPEISRDINWQVERRLTELFAEMITNFAKTGHPTPKDSGFYFDWTSFSEPELNYLAIKENPEMQLGFHWRGHTFWNWYVRHLDAIDIGNLRYIEALQNKIDDCWICFGGRNLF